MDIRTGIESYVKVPSINTYQADTLKMPSSDLSSGIRLRSLCFNLPGQPIPLSEVNASEEMTDLMAGTGQEFTFCTQDTSTDLAVIAARKSMQEAGVKADQIGLVISAPTLLTSYGFEIPAVGVRAALGINGADCLNVAQGCTGFMVAMHLASQFLQCEPDRGDVLVVTACKASSLLDGFTHGSFFWGDGAAAAVVTREKGTGLFLQAYSEVSSDQDWGAMRLRYGDAVDFRSCQPSEDLRITVDFPDQRAQMDYIAGEQHRCKALVDSLLDKAGIEEGLIDAVFMPSIGKNRMPYLLGDYPRLLDKLKTNFSYAHMGGVDVMFFMQTYLEAHPAAEEKWFLAMTPAFTAQWGGVLFSYKV